MRFGAEDTLLRLSAQLEQSLPVVWPPPFRARRGRDRLSATVANRRGFRVKGRPVRVKKTRQIEESKPRFDLIETNKGSSGPVYTFASRRGSLFCEYEN